MKDVDLLKKIYRDAQREFEHLQAAIGVLGKLDIWGCGRRDWCRMTTPGGWSYQPWRKRLADRREWTLSVRQALATVAVLAPDNRCDQGHDAVNREIVLRLTS
jgi:hypothetical protein